VVRRINAILTAAIALAAIALLNLTPVGGLPGLLALTLAPVAAVSVWRRDWVPAAAWTAFVLGLHAFMFLRSMADDVGFPVRYGYPILLDRALFFGAVPTVWLQALFYTPGKLNALDWAMLWTHVSYFAVPSAVAFALLLFRPDSFTPFLAAMLATAYVALPVHVLVPTAPPWLAGNAGVLPPVARIMQEAIGVQTWNDGVALVGDNAVAAMPSLHTAFTMLVALALARFGREAAVLGWVYLTTMAFALVYLGEHYVVDEIAGAALAWICWGACTSRRQTLRRPSARGVNRPSHRTISPP
jgi:membrane-associated phospholipid phosphatase